MAVYPGGINAAHTVLLEPWLVLFCLAGALALFEGDELTTSRSRLVWAGLAFGFAGAIKLWAVFPVLVTLALWWRRGSWRPPIAYLGGLAAGFFVPVVPFFALAPSSFVRDVVTSQLSRVDVARVSLSDRLTNLSGLAAFSHVSRALVLVWCLALGAFVAGCVLRASFVSRRPPPRLEWFALLSAVLVLASFLWPPDYYLHYGWFFAPFLGLALALPAGRSRWSSVGSVLLIGSAAIVIVVMAEVQLRQEARLNAFSPSAAAQRQIVAGACVLTDNSALTIVAGRFTARSAGCSAMVDAIGTDYALGSGRNGVTGAGRVPALQTVWRTALAHAQYVWIACPPQAGAGCKSNRRIPWTPSLTEYFSHHFRRVPGTEALGYLYRRDPPGRA
jgi:hypothetical protein